MLRPFRERLGRYYLAVLAIALVVFAVCTYGAVRADVVATADNANRRLLAPAAAGFASSAETLPQLFHEFDEFTLEPEEKAAVLAPDGAVLYWRGAQPRPERVALASRPFDEGPLRSLVVPLRRGGHDEGALYIARSLAGERRVLAALASALTAMSLAVLLLAALGGRWLAERASEPVEAAIARERQFTRDASHELRTPLAVLQLQLQLSREAARSQPELDGRLAAVELTLGRMGRLIDSLLVLARGEAGLPGPRLRFSFTDVVEEELESLAPLAASRGITLEVTLPEGEALVEGCPESVGRAVRNLLDNAMRYGSAPGPVTVTLSSDGTRHTLAVASPGTPLAGAERTHIFDRFGRTESGRSANPEGAGLGLPISRAIAAAHGGSLDLATVSPTGNIFELRVPAAT